jgi:hypothetical protein
MSGDREKPARMRKISWAVALLDHVIARLQSECEARGDGAVFDRLKDFLMLETSGVSYEEAGTALGLTAAAARVIVHRLRKRYRELLRHEIAQTLSDPSQVDEEMRTLFEAFRG